MSTMDPELRHTFKKNMSAQGSILPFGCLVIAAAPMTEMLTSEPFNPCQYL